MLGCGIDRDGVGSFGSLDRLTDPYTTTTPHKPTNPQTPGAQSPPPPRPERLRIRHGQARGGRPAHPRAAAVRAGRAGLVRLCPWDALLPDRRHQRLREVGRLVRFGVASGADPWAATPCEWPVGPPMLSIHRQPTPTPNTPQNPHHHHSVPQECSIQDVFTATFPPIVQKLAARSHGVCGPVNRDATLFIAAEPLSPAAVSTLVFLALLALTALAATLMDVVGERKRLVHWERGGGPALKLPPNQIKTKQNNPPKQTSTAPAGGPAGRCPC